MIRSSGPDLDFDVSPVFVSGNTMYASCHIFKKAQLHSPSRINILAYVIHDVIQDSKLND